MDYKNQHFVTEAYLKEWCDPEPPQGYGSYVWIISKRDRRAKRKSPRNIFSETDFYTLIDSKGNRNLYIEKVLQKIESSFIPVLRDKISHRVPLDGEEMIIVATFVASMFARVKKQRDQQKEMWQEGLNEMDKAPEGVLAYLKATGVYNQFVELRKQPLPYNIVNFTNIAVPFFAQMNLEVLETETKPGFITSDNPCFMIDPATLTPNGPKSWHEVFSSPTFEILFPISPKQLISLKPAGASIYRSIDETPEAIDEINKIIFQNSAEFIIVNQKEFKDVWFENI
jgi:hypothetical protein